MGVRWRIPLSLLPPVAYIVFNLNGKYSARPLLRVVVVDVVCVCVCVCVSHRLIEVSHLRRHKPPPLIFFLHLFCYKTSTGAA